MKNQGKDVAFVLSPNLGRNFGDTALAELLYSQFPKSLFVYEQAYMGKVLAGQRIDALRLTHPKATAWMIMNNRPGIRHLYVLGNDVMDGKYGYVSPIKKLSLLKEMTKRGVSTTLLNFSLKERMLPPSIASRFLKLNESGTFFKPRTNLSALTLQNYGINSTVIPDLACALFNQWYLRAVNENSTREKDVKKKMILAPSLHSPNWKHESQIYQEAYKIGVEKGYEVKFVASIPHIKFRRSDTGFIREKIIGRLDLQESKPVVIDGSFETIRSEILTSSVIFSSRTHIGLAGVFLAKPTISSYPEKNEPFFSDLGLRHNCIQSASKIIEKLSNALDLKEEIELLSTKRRHEIALTQDEFLRTI